MNERFGPIAAVMCPSCEISDTADAFYVRDPKDNALVCVVLRCVVCEYLHLVVGGIR